MNKPLTSYCRLFSLLSLLTFYLGAGAQTPMYAPTTLAPGGAQTIPFNSYAVPSTPPPQPFRHQTLYLPGEFGNALPTHHYINRVYIRTSTVASNVAYDNFEVSLGQNSITSFPSAWQTVTPVFSQLSYSPPAHVIGGWIAIDLTTPFLYDPSLSLIIEFKFTSATGVGFGCYSNTSITGNRRIYNTNPASTVPMTPNASRLDLGFDLTQYPVGNDNARLMGLVEPKLFCTGNHDVKVKVGNRGANVIQSLYIKWSVDNNAQQPFFHNVPIDTLNSPNGSSDTILTLGNIALGSTPSVIQVWTEYPNNIPDVNTSDDTFNIILKAGLSGTYSIGGTTPDYPDFASAINELNVFGVCGPVTFNVAPGIYNGQIRLNEIPGASAVNTITFDGGAASTTRLTYSAALADSRHTVLLNGSKHIRLRNFTIESTGAYGWPLHILALPAAPASDIRVSKCVFDMATSATTNNHTGIVINGAANAPTTGGRADSIIIDSNVINNGYYGVACIGLTGNVGVDNEFTNNVFNYQAYNGVWVTYQNGINISGNTITGRETGLSYGIYYSNGVSTAPRFANIQRNRVVNMSTYGISITGSNNTPTHMGILANNEVGGVFTAATPSALMVGTGSYWNIYHNTINNTGAGNAAGASAMNVTTATNLDVRNNIFTVTNPLSQGVVITATNATSFTSLDHNIYYKPDTSGGILSIGGNTLYPSTFKGNAGLDLSSSYQDPGFANDSTLGSSSGCFNGTNLGVLTDIKGNPRGSVPDIGCFEFQSVANDIAVEAVTAPAFPMSSGLNDVVVRLRNLGNNVITSANISYTYNNNTVTTTWYGSLGICDTTSFIFNSSYQLDLLPELNALKVFTHAPNYSADGNTANDTLVINVGSPLHGVYTIGGISADFNSISAALGALNSVGINGPVAFDIRKGTYQESNLFTSIKGAGPGSPVTFRSEDGHPDSVIINYSALGTTDNYVFKFFNASYINLEALTINALNTTNGRGIELTGSSSFDTIRNCKINAPSTTTTSNALCGIYGQNLPGSYCVIKNNIITGGAYNLYLYGSAGESKITPATKVTTKNMQVEGNMLNGAGYSALTASSHVSIKVRNNTVNAPSLTNASYTAMQISSSDSAIEITGNKVTAVNVSATTVYGIRVTSCVGTGVMPGMVANNATVTGSSSVAANTNNYAFHMSSNSNFTYLNNNTNALGGTSNNYGGYFNFSSTHVNNVVRNNIFCNRGTTGYALFVQDPGYISSDYNLFYSTGAGGLIYKAATVALSSATLNVYRSMFPLQEVNSIQYRAPYTSNTDLSINTSDSACWALNGRGIHTANNKDITGNTRSTLIINGASDIGAYEFTPAVPALLTTAVPSSPVAGTTQAFLLFGDTVARISWDANGAVPDVFSLRFYTGEYAPNTYPQNYRTNCYWDVEETGVGYYYYYAVDLYYKETMKGSVVTEADMRLAKQHGTNPWAWYTGQTSSVDPVRNILSASGLYDFSVFTGTDDQNPLPVKLAQFDAQRVGKDVHVRWATATEKNASHFIVEASVDGKAFVPAGKMNAAGESSAVKSYRFIHEDVEQTLKSELVYYRLIPVDKDGSRSTSPVVIVRFDSKPHNEAEVYPNPFVHQLHVKLVSAEEGIAGVNITDVSGKTVMHLNKQIAKGINELVINETQSLNKGIYFIKIMLPGSGSVIKKVIKN